MVPGAAVEGPGPGGPKRWRLMDTDVAPALLGGEEVRYLRFPNITTPHGFSTRLGGVSQGAYRSLNIGQTSADIPRRVHENRARLARELGIPLVRILNMVHGTHVVRVNGPQPSVRTGDACITDRPGVAMMITTADCVPLFFHDPVRGAVGLAHAGWRGTVQGVARTTVEAMTAEFGSRPADLRVAIAPAIGPCCFEVDSDVSQPFLQGFPGKDLVQARVNKFTIDLWRANEIVLRDAGVRGENILVCRVCTSCREDLFFSFRRDRKVTGRMAAVISLP